MCPIYRHVVFFPKLDTKPFKELITVSFSTIDLHVVHIRQKTNNGLGKWIIERHEHCPSLLGN